MMTRQYVYKLIFLANIYMQVQPETTSTDLACRCNHLTHFAGQYLIPPNPVNIGHLALLSEIKHNPVVLSVILVVWTTFLLLLLWAKQHDKSDHMNVGIHVYV